MRTRAISAPRSSDRPSTTAGALGSWRSMRPTVLWRETLHHEVPIEPDDPDDLDDFGGAWHVDLVSTGSAENIRAWLMYYADEQTRDHWRREYPEDDMPAHQDPPYDRDRHLP
jgi:hypothetical protein